MRMCERELQAARAAGGRSASVCGGTPERRRRPATRSQSARVPGHKPRPKPQSNLLRPAGSDTRLDAPDGSRRESLEADSSKPGKGSSQGLEVGGGCSGRRGSTRRVHIQRKSAAFLDVPEPPSPISSGLDPEDEDSLRIRSFSFNSKGTGIINRGDSFRKRRSRSNSVGGGTPPLSPLPSSPTPSSHGVQMLGAVGVGKTALVSQFMTSECINAYDRQKDEPSQQSVLVMLNGEESELKFITDIQAPGTEEDPADLYVVMYSVIDKASFQKAESELSRLSKSPFTRSRPTILVANKVDLVRSRLVSAQDGKCVACTYGSKFIEISVGINHNVDELLVGILTQIRLKEASPGESPSSRHWPRSHGVLRASLKARQMFTWIFGKEDPKFKNCENLHML